VARFKLSLNEGSLLRRTVLHVGAFVLGTAAFLALSSFLLVTLLKGLLPSEKSATSTSEDSSEEAAASPGSSSRAGGRPPPRKRRGAPAPVAAPSDDE
jgi:hypothetical protein